MSPGLNYVTGLFMTKIITSSVLRTREISGRKHQHTGRSIANKKMMHGCAEHLSGYRPQHTSSEVNSQCTVMCFFK